MDQAIGNALLLILDRIEAVQGEAESATKIAMATRSALSASLKESNPELEAKFQGWLDRFQSIVETRGADRELDEIRKQLSPLLPK